MIVNKDDDIIIKIYNIDEYIYIISKEIYSLRYPLKRNMIIKLIKDYVDEQLSHNHHGWNHFEPFNNALDDIFDDMVQRNEIIQLFDIVLCQLVDEIIISSEINNKSFVTTLIIKCGVTICLEVKNNGDYRIVEYELKRLGYLHDE